MNLEMEGCRFEGCGWQTSAYGAFNLQSFDKDNGVSYDQVDRAIFRNCTFSNDNDGTNGYGWGNLFYAPYMDKPIDLEYKNFDLTMFWQGVQGVDIISDVKKKSDFWSASNVGFLNKGTRLLNAWSPTNPNSTIPALTRSDTNNEQRVSTYFVEKGSFLKLRNIQLGYTVPAVISKKLRMERLRFYCSAQNLLTIKSKDFTGEDPENPNFSYPIPVNITFGLNIGF